MSTPVRLAAFALVLVTGLGGGYALGAAVGPLDRGTAPTHDTAPTTTAPHDMEEHGS